MGSQLGVVLVTVLFLIIYTKSKATYRRTPLTGGLFIVSMDESMIITASSLAAGRQGWRWSSSWEFTPYPQTWGGENKTEPGCFFETAKPTDTPPPTRPLLLILPKQSITASQPFECTNLGGGYSQSNHDGGAVGSGGTAWLGEIQHQGRLPACDQKCDFSASRSYPHACCLLQYCHPTIKIMSLGPSAKIILSSLNRLWSCFITGAERVSGVFWKHHICTSRSQKLVEPFVITS